MKKLLLLLTIVLCVACGKDAIEEMDVYTPPAGAVVDTPTPTQTQTQTTSDDRTFFQANEGKWFSDSVTEFEGYDGTTIVYDEGEEAGLLITSAKMLGYYFPESDCASEDDAETIIENTATKLVYYSDRTDSDGYQEDIYTFTRSGDNVIAVLEDKLDGTLEFRSTRTFITTDIDFSAACGNYKDFFGIVEITTDVSSEIETSNELTLKTDLNDDSDYLDSAQRTITTTKTLTNGEETGVVSSTNDWEITEDVAFDPTSVSKILTCIDRCHSGRAYAFIDGKVIAVIYGIDGDLSISTPSNSTFNFDDLEIVSHNPIEGTYVVRRISDQYWWTVGDEFDGTIDEFVAYVTDQGNSIYNGYEGQVQDGIYVSEKRRSSGVNENDLANTSFGPHSGYQFEVVNNKIVDYSTYSSANEEWTNWGKELGWNNVDKVNVTAWSDTQISVTHGYEGAPNSIVQFIAIQSDLTILAGTVVEDPADTAEYSGWTEWVPAQGDGSAPTFTQTRERGCIIYINGEEDNPPAQCGDDKVQTREVADTNYEAPSTGFTDEQIASFQSALVAAGYHQWTGDSNGLTYRINKPNFGNLYIQIRQDDFLLYAWVSSENGIVTIGTESTVEAALSAITQFYENGNTAPDEYIVDKGIENVRGETNWKLITNTGAEYCVNYDYWTNVEYTSGNGYTFTEVDQSQVIDCVTGEQDGEDADYTPFLDLGFVSDEVPSYLQPNTIAYFTHPNKAVSIRHTPVSSVPFWVSWVNGDSTGEGFYTVAEAAAYVADYVGDSLPTVNIEIIEDKFFYTYVASNGNRIGTSETTFKITGSDAEGPVKLQHSVSSSKVKSWNPDTGILVLKGFSLSSTDHFWVYAYDSYNQRAEKKAVFTSLPTQSFYIGLVEQKLIDLMTSYGFAYSSEHAGAYIYNGDYTIYVLHNLDSEGRVSNFTFHYGDDHTTWSISSTTNPDDALDELENQFKSKL